jgi:hypothetical protein
VPEIGIGNVIASLIFSRVLYIAYWVCELRGRRRRADRRLTSRCACSPGGATVRCGSLDSARSQRYKRTVLIALIIIVVFVTASELLLFYARRHPQLVAKLYGLGYLFESDAKTSRTDNAPNRPEPRDEDERH